MISLNLDKNGVQDMCHSNNTDASPTNHDSYDNYDIVIVGGGPAGCMLALLLAHTHLRIAILEKNAHPVQRPCGEFLSPEGLRILKKAGVLDDVMATGAQTLQGLDLVSGNHRLGSDYKKFLGCSPEFPHGLGLRRERFDRALQDACKKRNVTFIHSCHCRSIQYSPHTQRWCIEAEIEERHLQVTTQVLVGADGRNSRIRHWAGLNKPVKRKRYGLMCRASEIPFGSHGEMHIGPLGQVGLAPIGEGQVNLNLLLSPYGQTLLQKFGPSGCMTLALRHTKSLHTRCAHAHLEKVYATPSLPQESTKVTDTGLALLGDAAGFCDPFTGEGMCIALQSAEMLARELLQWNPQHGFQQRFLTAYAKTYRQHFGWRRKMVKGIQRILDRRTSSDLIIKTSSWSKYAAIVAISLTGDYVQFRHQ